MGRHEDDRIRHKNNKYINMRASRVIRDLMSDDPNILESLDELIEKSNNDVEREIYNKAKNIYRRRSEMTNIEKRFGPYRKPTQDTIPKYESIQGKTLELAKLIDELCPESREKSSALTLLQQAKMSANAAIAIYTEQQE